MQILGRQSEAQEQRDPDPWNESQEKTYWQH